MIQDFLRGILVWMPSVTHAVLLPFNQISEVPIGASAAKFHPMEGGGDTELLYELAEALHNDVKLSTFFRRPFKKLFC